MKKIGSFMLPDAVNPFDYDSLLPELLEEFGESFYDDQDSLDKAYKEGSIECVYDEDEGCEMINIYCL